MTYEQADRIIRTSNYEERGKALIQMDLITPAQYEMDYQGVSKALGKLQHNERESIRLATIILDNRRDK